MEFGISTFGEVTPDHVPGGGMNAHARMQELLLEAKLTDEVGLDVFAIGEHHRPDYVISAPEVALAAVAAVTKHVRLSSAVTVLSSADPVRTFQNFATLDLISGGRAEIMAGRGSFIESFPLFGYHLNEYDELFIEKLDMLTQINNNEVLTWKGKFRAPIRERGIYPRPYQNRLPIWLAIGGTPASAARAGRMGLGMTVAILGGLPKQFLNIVELFRKSATDAGHNPAAMPLAINCHTYVAEDSETAANEFWPIYERVMNKIGQERGWSPISRAQFEYLRSQEGPLLVGSVQEVTDKLIYLSKIFNNTRFLAQILKGALPHDKILNSIELFGRKVAPAVRAQLQAVQ